MSLQTFPTHLHATIRPGWYASEDGFFAVKFDGLASYKAALDIFDQARPQIIENTVHNWDGSSFFVTSDLRLLQNGVEKPLYEEPSDGIKTDISGGVLSHGINPKVMESYKKGLQFLERTVLKNPNDFFEKDVQRIKDTLILSHKAMYAYDEKAGQLRDARAFAPMSDGEGLGRSVDELVEKGIFKEYPRPDEPPEKLDEIALKIKDLGLKILQREVHADEAAAEIHMDIVNAHPFVGNGRLARAWINVMLQVAGIPAVSFIREEEYLDAVREGKDKLVEEIRIMHNNAPKFFPETPSI